MKQTEMFRKAKPKFCNWMFPKTWACCARPATVTIKGAAYCAEHAEQAAKMFGPSTPIYAK